MNLIQGPGFEIEKRLNDEAQFFESKISEGNQENRWLIVLLLVFVFVLAA